MLRRKKRRERIRSVGGGKRPTFTTLGEGGGRWTFGRIIGKIFDLRYGIAWWMNQSVQKIEAQKAGCPRMTRRQYADKAFNKVNSNYKFSFTPFRDVFQRRSEPIKRSLQRIDERKKRFDSNLLCFALKFSTLSFSPENSHPWQKSLLRHIFLQYFL